MPKDYIINRPYTRFQQVVAHLFKVERAYILMKQQNKSLREIAMAVGRNDYESAQLLFQKEWPKLLSPGMRVIYYPIEYKLELLRRYEAYKRLGGNFQEVCRRAGIKYATFKSWLYAHRKDGIQGLIDKRPGTRVPYENVTPAEVKIWKPEELKEIAARLRKHSTKDDLTYIEPTLLMYKSNETPDPYEILD